jgi:linoleate 10R-lipoxygenase
MFRRLSKTFNRKKEINKDKVNGYSNGPVNGTSGKAAVTTNGHASESSSDHARSNESPATREDVQSTFEQYAQLIHSAQRPLPNQSGDGAYLEKEEPSGFWADIKALGLKDVRTVRHIMEDKASGKPQDDKKMHMEEIMQVCRKASFQTQRLTSSSLWQHCLLVPTIGWS